jgi:hypothetical protein
MRASASPVARALSLAALLWSAGLGWSLTLEEIRQMPELTPRKFAALFSNFEFKFRAEIQSPEVFLATESGDCDDYATLAAEVLRDRGYTPRLVTVRMPKLVHVVCYIEETRSYLDYNNRGFFMRTVSCGGTLEEIARKVAKASDLPWTSASEFTYEAGMKRLVKTVTPTGSRPQQVATLGQ